MSETLLAKQKSNLPEINIMWDPRRGNLGEGIGFKESLKKPVAYETLGRKNAGKSSLSEVLAAHYPKVIDLFGSRDNEGLCWVRSPFGKQVLFLKGNSVKIDCNCADIINATDVKVSDFEKYQAVVSCSCFYGDMTEEWHALTKLMSKLWHRSYWTEPWCVLIREAANLLYSRLALGENQYQAKNYMIYVLREMRHHGYALALDTLRMYSIDADVRALSDFIFIKALGIEGLQAELRWVYKYYKPKSLMKLKPEQFIIVSNCGPLGVGWFDYPSWHKKEHENLIREFDIQITYGQVPHIPGSGSSQVGDYEHLRIIKSRIETGKSMDVLAAELGRSSRTIHKHITLHNNMIRTLGECDTCARVNGEYKRRVTD